MDISEEYREMCSKAQEVQNEREKFLDGDFLVSCRINWESSGTLEKKGVIEFLDTHVYNNSLGINDRGLCIWLPRQDQLQDIIIDKYKEEEFPIYVMLECMYNYEGGLGNSSEDRSLEQAWLAFIMIEKYNKQWNPKTKEWEKS